MGIEKLNCWKFEMEITIIKKIVKEKKLKYVNII